jgi:hypothetical protein
MKRRSLFRTLAVGVLALGFGALDARAGSYVPLPTTLDQLLPAGTFTKAFGAETLTFSNFTYSSSSSPPPGSPGPAASTLGVVNYAVGNETGISLTGTLSASANTLVDVAISYIVTAPKGQLINDALLSTTGGNFGGTGSYSVSETLLSNTTPPVFLTTLEATNTLPFDFAGGMGYQSILVSKDIFLSGGSKGVTLSVITQAFSSTGVPEPASFALLGIGMTGFLALRRFFKKTHVA